MDIDAIRVDIEKAENDINKILEELQIKTNIGVLTIFTNSDDFKIVNGKLVNVYKTEIILDF
jgi:hypothetical protein